MSVAPGHFGELMQGRIGADGPVALISLPCPALHVQAAMAPARRLALHSPQGRLIGPAQARRLLGALGLPLRGRFVLRATMPLGGGAGSSTAALVALARAAGFDGTAMDLARACLAIEGASDPLMLAAPERLLWASRQGRILGQSAPLPDFDIIGGFWGENRRTDPKDLHFPDISDLWPLWKAAAMAQDLVALAQLATTSAQRTLDLRPPQRGEVIFDLAAELGALGVVLAHTGAARGLIFPRGGVPKAGLAALRAAGFTGTLGFAHRSAR